MKTVFDLTEEQIEFLKESYALQLLETDGEDVFCGFGDHLGKGEGQSFNQVLRRTT